MFEHRVPVPQLPYTDVDTPSIDILQASIAAQILNWFVNMPNADAPENSSKLPPSLLRSINILGYEINNVFQKEVYKRIHEEPRTVGHNERLVSVVDPSPEIPLQSLDKVFGLITRVLNRIGEERRPLNFKRYMPTPCDWLDILSEDALLGSAFSRCSKLFATDSTELKRDKYQMLNLMYNTEPFYNFNGNQSKKGKMKMRAKSAVIDGPSVPSNEELLDAYKIDMNMPDEYWKTARLFKRLAKDKATTS